MKPALSRGKSEDFNFSSSIIGLDDEKIRNFADAEEGLSLEAGSFLWPYIIPANIPLGIQYYHLGLVCMNVFSHFNR